MQTMTLEKISAALNTVKRYELEDTSRAWAQRYDELIERRWGDWIKVEDVAAALGLVRRLDDFEVP